MPPQNLEGTCAIHCTVEKRNDEKWQAQDVTNRDLFSKMNSLHAKMNWVLGAVAVGWPLILVIIHLLSKVKP